MKIKSRLQIFSFVLILLSGVFFLAASAKAECKAGMCIDRERAAYPLSYLKGIITLVVQVSINPAAAKLPWAVGRAGVKPNEIFFETVGKIFSNTPRVYVLNGASDNGLESHKSSAMQLIFTVTARDVVVRDMPVSVVALQLTLHQRRASEGKDDQINTVPVVSYPYIFVAPANEAELKSKIEEGVEYLADYLPSYFACANEQGDDLCSNLKQPNQ